MTSFLKKNIKHRPKYQIEIKAISYLDSATGSHLDGTASFTSFRKTSGEAVKCKLYREIK